MAKQVAARMKGDIYQIRFFWFKAAEMLQAESNIEKVTLERDDVSIVDDVGVYYRHPGLKFELENITEDLYQVKFQVSHNRTITIDNLLDPAFFKTKESFIKRLYDSFQKIKTSESNARLHLVTNYQWDTNDTTLAHIDDDGHFRNSFFVATPRSRAGKIRKKILEHLDVDETEGKEFLSRIYFEHGFLSSDNMKHWVCDRFYAANLIPIDFEKVHSPYDDLGRKFIEAGKQEFNAKELRHICEEEGLTPRTIPNVKTRIGIKSFKRCAEEMGTECRAHLDLTSLFDRRYVLSKDDWDGAISEKVRDFLSVGQLKKLAEPIELRIDAHTSIAFLAGYLLDPKAGINVQPIQKDSVNGFQLWNHAKYSSKEELLNEETNINNESSDLAIALSISHDIKDDVRAYCENKEFNTSYLYETISQGPGIKAIENGAHAHAVADEFQRKVLKLRKSLKPENIHLFLAAPCALVFLTGQRSRGFGRMVLYEYDFEGQQDYSYIEGISIPNDRVE